MTDRSRSGSPESEADPAQRARQEHLNQVLAGTRFKSAVERLCSGEIAAQALLAVLDELNAGRRPDRYIPEIMALKRESAALSTAPYAKPLAEFLSEAARRIPFMNAGLASQTAVTLAAAADNPAYAEVVSQVVGDLIVDLDRPLSGETRQFFRALIDKLEASRRLQQAKSALAQVPSLYPQAPPPEPSPVAETPRSPEVEATPVAPQRPPPPPRERIQPAPQIELERGAPLAPETPLQAPPALATPLPQATIESWRPLLDELHDKPASAEPCAVAPPPSTAAERAPTPPPRERAPLSQPAPAQRRAAPGERRSRVGLIVLATLAVAAAAAAIWFASRPASETPQPSPAASAVSSAQPGASSSSAALAAASAASSDAEPTPSAQPATSAATEPAPSEQQPAATAAPVVTRRALAPVAPKPAPPRVSKPRVAASKPAPVNEPPGDVARSAAERTSRSAANNAAPSRSSAKAASAPAVSDSAAESAAAAPSTSATASAKQPLSAASAAAPAPATEPRAAAPKPRRSIDQALSALRQTPMDPDVIEARASEVASLVADASRSDAAIILSRLLPEDVLSGFDGQPFQVLEPVRRAVALTLRKVALDRDDTRAVRAVEVLGEWAKSRKHGAAAKLTLDQLAREAMITTRARRQSALNRVRAALATGATRE